ncbi:MAG: V4R domain-containing protein [Methanobacteriaceae archaeon]|nr:V4R domain-containing protein [Methanobacteriaceae archaeon]
MNDDDLKKAVDYYRLLVEKEIAMENVVDGNFIGPRELIKKDQIDLKDMINPVRPFLGEESSEDLDKCYVTAFRVGNLKKPAFMIKSEQGTDIIAGIDLGANLVKDGLINSIDDIIHFLAKYKIGILDIFKEEEIEGGKKLDLRFYECIECAALPNIGKPVCFFETGMIIGMLNQINKKEVNVEEIRCWTSGYSFCQFDVEIK